MMKMKAKLAEVNSMKRELQQLQHENEHLKSEQQKSFDQSRDTIQDLETKLQKGNAIIRSLMNKTHRQNIQGNIIDELNTIRESNEALERENAELRSELLTISGRTSDLGDTDIEQRLKETTSLNKKLNTLLEVSHKRTRQLQEQLTSLRDQNLELSKKLKCC